MQKNKIFIPILLKLTIVSFLILLLTVIPMMKKSLDIFEKTSRRSNEESNLNQAMQKSQEIETLVMSYLDKARTLGSFMLDEKLRKEEALVIEKQDIPLEFNNEKKAEIQNARRSIENIFKLDKELLAVELYEVKSGAPTFLARESKEEKWAVLGLESTYIDKVKKRKPPPLIKIVQGQIVIFNFSDVINHSELKSQENTKNRLSLLLVGAPLATNSAGQVTQFVVTYVDLNRLQRLFSSKGGRSTFVTDDSGNLIVHSYQKYTEMKTTFSGHPVIKKAITDQSQKKQLKYIHPEKNESFLAAYVKSPLGLIFVSEVSEKTVLVPVRLVQRQSIYVAGVMLSLMLILIFLFSTSITIPIERLVSIAKQIAKGDFEINARASVKSLDEVGTLAQAFDEMVGGLKERDKVKTLFSKFHGSDIAEEMMAGEISVKGSNKDVTVFFSDVRGFTAFSEGRSPEEVVEMLNEYFQRMVHIINANHGVVDKFIGDAIMAVWGAPKSTGDDAYWCVKACLEMRQELADLNALRATRGQGPIMIGMGVHSGAAISGTIGSDERMEFTVIGDTVNQTSRIEASTKAFGTDLLLSDITAEKVKDRFLLDYAGSAEVKGKTEPLKFFKVKGYLSADGIVKLVETPYSEYKAEKADKVKVVA